MQSLSSNTPAFTGRLTPCNAAEYICNRVENVVVAAVALHKVAQFGVNHGTEAVCSAVTIWTGVEMLLAGNLMTGAGITLAGTKQALNILYPAQTDVKELLQNARAGIDMITILEKANQDTFANVDANLNIVKQNVQDLEARLKDIRNIADRGSKKLKAQKEKAAGLYQEALQSFKKTQLILNHSQSQINRANLNFTFALCRIDELVNLAQEQGGDLEERVARFATLSKEIHSECTDAKQVLEEGNSGLTEGLQCLNEALTKFNAATYEAGKASQMALSKFEKIKSRAQIEESCQGKIEEIRSELNQAKERSEDILAIAHQTDSYLAQAEELSDVKFGYQSIILGGGVGACLGAAFGGGMGAFAAAPAGVVAYHNRETIGNLLFGKDPEATPAKPTPKNPVTYEFNKHSSGFWGRYIQKRGSETVGRIAIDLGDDKSTLSLTFNFNKKEVISRKELKNVYEELSQRLSDERITPEACLAIITRLENLEIDRGSRGRAKGVIPQNDPFFNELKRRANRLMN